MRTPKKPQQSKKRPKAPRSDSLTKTTRKGDIELSEQDLKRVSGGVKMNYPSKI